MRPRAFLVVALLALVSVLACSDPEAGAPGGRAGTSDSLGRTSRSPAIATSPPEPPTEKPPGDDETRAVAGGVSIEQVPGRARRLCVEGPPLSKACPGFVPVAKTPYLVDSFGRPGGRFQVLELAAGAPSNTRPGRNRPPRVSHVVVEAGRSDFLIDLGDPSPTATDLEDLVEQRRSESYVVSHRAWPGRELILAESFPGGGAHGDHLVWRRERGGITQVVSLHVWAPVAETVHTLRAIVRSI